jgi:hypothetical protein
MLNLYKYHANPEKLNQTASSPEAGFDMGVFLGKKIILSPKSSEKYLTHADAVKYAESSKNWRLPTIEELVYIYNYITKTFHDDRYLFKDAAYWSSTMGNDRDMAWIKHMQTGSQMDYYADGKAMVRLIKK